MKSVIINKYGSANELQLAELPTPTLKSNEVLVENQYTCVNPWDTKVRNGSMKIFTGSKFPKVLGVEFAGIVSDIGTSVTKFKKGDRVAAVTGVKVGTYSEYIVLSESKIAKLPDQVSFKEGATFQVASTAYNSLHKLGKIKAGDNVLINGAYGGVGIMAVQLAKLAGANVTAICSTSNIENVKALGVDKVIDYTKQDISSLSGQYEILFDTVSKLDFKKVKHLLSPKGVMIFTLPTPKAILQQLLTIFSSKKYKAINNAPTVENIELLGNLMADGKLKVVFDREYSFNELPQAHQYIETERAKGKVMIKVK